MDGQAETSFAGMEKEVKEAIERFQRISSGTWRQAQPSVSQDSINRMLLSRWEDLKNSLGREVKEKFKEILVHYMQQSSSFLNEVAENLPAFLDTGIDSIAVRFDLDVYSSAYFSLNGLEQSVPYKGGPLSFLKSEDAKKREWADMLARRYHELLVTNMAAVCYDIQYRVQESFRKFDTGLKDQLRRLFSILENEIKLVSRQRDQVTEALDATLQQLRREKDRLYHY